jgi:hypothetical protein
VRYEVRLEQTKRGPAHEEPSITHERLTPLAEAKDTWIVRHPDFKPLARYGQQLDIVSLLQEEPKEEVSWEYVVIPKAPGLRSTLLEETRHKTIEQFPQLLAPRAIQLATMQLLRSWRFLQLDPFRLRLPSETADAARLARDGSNLPTVVAALPVEKQALVRADLARFVPGVANFEIISRDDELQIEVAMMDGQRLPARLLSDGTLRLLALLVLLHSSPPGALIGVEQPEDGIYPGQLRALIEELKKFALPGGELQILLNSHSPAVVAALQKTPSAIVFADLVYRDGLRSTRMRRVQDPPPDRGATAVSSKEVKRYLGTAQAEELP